jgi:hypothetical protein
MSLDLKRGNFLLSAETEDRATKQRYLDSGIPLYMAVALGQPVAAVQEQQLRDKYPDAAGLRDQETFNFGPHAKELGAQKNLMDARKMFPDWRDANAYAEAYTEAMYDGKYDKIRALKPSMKTFAMAQLDQEGQRLALEKERIAQTETHFIESQAQNLVNGSGWTLGMDTAKQYVRKTAYGDKVAPMSPEAVKEVEKWKGSVEATQQSAAATAYYELQIKQGKAQSEAREGLRSSLKTLIDMHKELGGKALETQMIAVKDELIKKEAADLGIDLSASNGNFWRDAIWNAAKSSMGVGQLSAAAATDAAKSNVSVSGAIAKDVIASVARHTLGQENIQRLATGQDMEGEQYADLGKILNQVFNVVTDPEGQSTLFSLSGTELGNKLQSAMKAVPGFRVAYQENLKAVLAQYKVEAEASNDPMVKDDRHMKMREIMKVLEGMGVK